jgi:hypothetical protein
MILAERSFNLYSKYSEIERESVLVDLPNFPKDEIEKCVRWMTVPYFPRAGRTAYIQLKEPICYREHVIRSVKLKGVGVSLPNGEVFPPTNHLVHNNNPHCGISDDGKFYPICSEPSPLGGLSLERAVNEFLNGLYLQKSGCRTIAPLQVFRYLDSGISSHKAIGVAVSGEPSFDSLRADAAARYPSSYSNFERHFIQNLLKMNGFQDDSRGILSLLRRIAKKMGKAIRAFSEAGMYRYSSALDNFGIYSVSENEDFELFLTDLDSSFYLEERPPIARGLEVVRDTASPLSYLLAYFLDPGNTERFGLSDIVMQDVFGEFLKGYYHDVDEAFIDTTAQMIFMYFAALYYRNTSGSVLSIKKVAMNEFHHMNPERFSKFLSANFERPWISRSESFSVLLTLCRVLHERSGLLKKLNAKLPSWEEYFLNIESYTNPKLRIFIQRLVEGM